MHQSWRVLRASILLTTVAACTETMPTGPGARVAAAPAFDEMAAAAAWDGTIRIGVVPSATSIAIGAADGGSYTLRDKATNAVLYAGSAPATVGLASGSVSETRWRLQVMCGSASAVAAKLAAAEALKHPTYTEVIPACTRLLIGSFPLNASFTQRNNYRLLLISQGLAASDAFWRQITIVTGVTKYAVTVAGTSLESLNPVVLTPDAGGLATINGAPYRGIAEVIRNSTGALAGVNQLPMEQYLYGVVPRELPPVPYGEMEAQKAQAVAARTYAMSGLGKRAADGYDLLPTTSDQVYGGYAAEHPVSNQAVDETAGIVAMYDGKLIQALFSSTSGGFTANNEEVYNSDPIAYLRGVPDAQRGAALEHVPTLEVFMRHANPTSLRAAKEGDFEADWSRYHRWTFEWSADEISAVVSDFAGRDVGTVHAINVTERGPSGRVMRIEFVTDEGTFVDTKDRIRSSLKYINASGTMSSLLSTLFFIEPVTDRKTGEIGFVAHGGGWGHGVGLSQTGAVGMAEKGATFDEILRHYYRDITLESAY